MEVLFASEKLSRAMSTQRVLRTDWGQDGAKKITLRLQQLAAAPTLAEMRKLPGRCHELTADRSGHFAVDVHKGYRLVFRPTAVPPPRKKDGGIDWAEIDSITVTEIVDYH